MTRLRDHAMAEATQRKRVEESQRFLAEVSVEFTSLDVIQQSQVGNTSLAQIALEKLIPKDQN
jgi:hypothetical protein